VLSTGNHYVLDMFGGLLTILAAMAIVEAVGRLRQQRRGSTIAPPA
jgi:hypothetical protein